MTVTRFGKRLKLFNGRGHGQWMRHHHAYIAAKSKADAARMMAQVFGFFSENSALRELNVYWHAGAWGNHMKDVNPERGVWVIDERERPIRPQKIFPTTENITQPPEEKRG